jgi:hypothetical protein
MIVEQASRHIEKKHRFSCNPWKIKAGREVGFWENTKRIEIWECTLWNKLPRVKDFVP